MNKTEPITEFSEVEKEYEIAKEMVLVALEQNENTRNNDNTLLFFVWEMQLKKKSFNILDAKQLVCAETIIRQRRKIQNEENKFLPTDPRTLFNRGIKEAAIRIYYSKNPLLLDHFVRIKYGVV